MSTLWKLITQAAKQARRSLPTFNVPSVLAMNATITAGQDRTGATIFEIFDRMQVPARPMIVRASAGTWANIAENNGATGWNASINYTEHPVAAGNIPTFFRNPFAAVKYSFEVPRDLAVGGCTFQLDATGLGGSDISQSFVMNRAKGGATVIIYQFVAPDLTRNQFFEPGYVQRESGVNAITISPGVTITGMPANIPYTVELLTYGQDDMLALARNIRKWDAQLAARAGQGAAALRLMREGRPNLVTAPATGDVDLDIMHALADAAGDVDNVD